jgi:hypothetical protein
MLEVSTNNILRRERKRKEGRKERNGKDIRAGNVGTEKPPSNGFSDCNVGVTSKAIH